MNTIRAHKAGCVDALSVSVDRCACGGRDFPETKAPPDVADLVRRLMKIGEDIGMMKRAAITDELYHAMERDADTILDAIAALEARQHGAPETESGGRSPSLAPLNGWRSMDTAPKDGTVILIGGKGWAATGFWTFVAAGWHWVTVGHAPGTFVFPIGWQPLPSPPSETP